MVHEGRAGMAFVCAHDDAISSPPAEYSPPGTCEPLAGGWHGVAIPEGFPRKASSWARRAAPRRHEG
eukprot:3082451-Alexandrium_andersonii.AAC.1